MRLWSDDGRTLINLLTYRPVNLSINTKTRIMKKSVLMLLIGCLFTLSAQAQKFALIDMEYIMKHIPAYEQAVTKLNSESEKYQREVEALSLEAKNVI